MKSLKLVVIEEDAAKAAVWREVLSDLECVTILESHRRKARSAHPYDAEVMAGMFAHERFGGTPEIGVSQVLNTQMKYDTPRYVITTPPFPAKWHYEPNPDGTRSIVADAVLSIINGSPIDKDGMAYEAFRTVFQTINRHNKESESPILSVGFVPELCVISGDPRSQAIAIKRAYLERRPQG